MKIPIDIKTGNLKVSEDHKDTIVGIDLGTTNSLVAYIRDESPIVIKDENDSFALMPSIIHFRENGKITVGHEAKKLLISHPETTIKSVKRLMGKSYEDIKESSKHNAYQIINDGSEGLIKIKMYDTFYSPVELSAEILSALRQRAEFFLKTTITKAVITVPAYFNDTQRQATRDAGKLAGLDVLRIINEPTAASLAYGIGLNDGQPEIVAVYDFGGGTFDVSILLIDHGIFEVLSTHGDTNLGGDDIDLAIVEYWITHNQLEEKNDISLTDNSLLTFAEEAKIALTKQDKYCNIFHGIEFSLTLPQFNLLLNPIIKKTIDAFNRALEDAKLDKKQLNKIVLVGGTTRIPLIKTILEETFGIKPFDSLNPDETVALGAAIQADILSGNRKDMLLLDVTPLSLGIETVGGLMDVIIPRNSKIPHKAARQYTTSIDGQKNLKISIYQGERDLVENNRKLGEFILKNIPPMPAGFPKLEIQLLIDADGILSVRAMELRSNTKAEIEINAAYGISEEKMAEMLLDSIKNAPDDAKAKAFIEAKVEATNLLLSCDKFLDQNQALMSEDEKRQFNLLVVKVKDSLNQNDKNKIESAMKILNDFATPIAQKSMDSLLGNALHGKSLKE
ncbi:MAG: Fe-S protein assembly chaperone HscA [Saprospiraceae bacterium]